MDWRCMNINKNRFEIMIFKILCFIMETVFNSFLGVFEIQLFKKLSLLVYVVDFVCSFFVEIVVNNIINQGEYFFVM